MPAATVDGQPGLAIPTLWRRSHTPQLLMLSSVAWRFIVMAIIASVLVEPARSTSNTLTEPGTVTNGPLHTLVRSLGDAEWQHWQERMSGWPNPVQDKLRAARRQMSAD